MGAPLAYRTRLQSCGGARTSTSSAVRPPWGGLLRGRCIFWGALSEHELHEGADIHTGSAGT